MGLKIRLARAGAKKRPYYHIVVADSRSPRDGRFIEKLGSYNPMLPAEARGSCPFAAGTDPALAEPRRAGHRAGGEVPRPCRPGADAGVERTADPVRAKEEGAGTRQGGRGRGGGLIARPSHALGVPILLGPCHWPRAWRARPGAGDQSHRRSRRSDRIRTAVRRGRGGRSRCAGWARASPRFPKSSPASR